MRKKVLSLSRKKKLRKISKVKKHILRDKIVGLLFLAIALVSLLLPQIFFTTKVNGSYPIEISSSLLTSKEIQNDPVRILIPKVGIDLKVVNAQIVNGYWELSEDTASYGLGSGKPGAKGNTVIFAHARDGLFYNLKEIKQDDVIYVFTKNNWFRYKVNKITQVFPNQKEVIEPTKNEVLTLYTCTGFLDEKRLIVTAIPQK